VNGFHSSFFLTQEWTNETGRGDAAASQPDPALCESLLELAFLTAANAADGGALPVLVERIFPSWRCMGLVYMD
jgi:hypothetical protein